MRKTHTHVGRLEKNFVKIYYKLTVFEEKEIIDVFKKAKISFSSRIIIFKVIDDLILKLILGH